MKKTLILSALMLVVACTKTLTIDGKYHHSEIVINGIFSLEEDTFEIFTTESTPVFGYEQEYKQNSGTKVSLFENGSLVDVLKLETTLKNENRYTSAYGAPYRLAYDGINANAKYTLQVAHPTLGIAKAETSFPTKVDVESVELKEERIRDEYGETYSALVAYVTFTDPSGEDNYYQVKDGYMLQGKVEMRDGFYNYNTDCWEYMPTDTIVIFKTEFPDSYGQVDPLIKPNETEIFSYTENMYNVFNDDIINGKEYALRYVVQKNWSSSSDKVYDIDTALGNFICVHFNLCSIPKDLYLYCISLDAFYWNDESPFSEPVQIFSNVDNGVGIVAAYHNSAKERYIGEYPMAGKSYFSSDEYQAYWY